MPLSISSSPIGRRQSLCGIVGSARGKVEALADSPSPAGLWTHLGAGAGLGDGCASGSGVGATPVPWVQAHLDARYARRRSQEEHLYGTSTEMGPLAVVHLAPGRAVEQVARRIGSPTDADKFLARTSGALSTPAISPR